MGKWYLVYSSFDSMENDLAAAQSQEKKELHASHEQVALVEARRLWSALSKNTYRGWDGGTYPNNPRLIYEVVLS